jgi:DUF971 family protein
LNPPKNIRLFKDEKVVEFEWDETLIKKIRFFDLRNLCPCATCINEFTGEKMLDPSTIPEDIFPKEMGFSGNYALKFHWSDGHHTGIYTWDHLKKVCEAAP